MKICSQYLEPKRAQVGMVALAVLVGCAVSSAARAESCSRPHTGRTVNPWGNALKLVLESEDGYIEEEAVGVAVDMWSRVCGNKLPQVSAVGNINVRLRFHRGPNTLEGCGNGCACTIVNTLPVSRGEEFVASTITHLFESNRDGSGYCASHRAETIAHELGHVLGFRHPEDPYNSQCSGVIMSFTPDRAVRQGDCEVASALWGK